MDFVAGSSIACRDLQDIVPDISRYSNTQNKVTLVDFSSNHPYHVKVEKITRSLWAPSPDGSGQETGGSTRGPVASTPTRREPVPRRWPACWPLPRSPPVIRLA